jgi:Zn-dependent peptidase ImmA (M78 family)/transcriptional regulator with XRE-family HTH domain
MGTPKPVTFRPPALWVARSFRGLTVSELADQADVSRQVVSALENGTLSPSPKTPAVGALADTLRFPLRFFFSEPSIPARDSLHFRKGAKVSERAISNARARASLFSRLAMSFGSFAHFSEPKVPKANPGDPEAIEGAAEKFRIAIGVGPDAPIANAIRAVEAAGVFVGSFDAGAVPIHGFAHSGNALVIMLNKGSVWSRQRHSVMHELGHLALHRTVSTPEQEEQASRFAGAVLCPRPSFWREFPRPARKEFNWASLIAMKQRWGTSIQALVRRAFDLSIINAAQYRTACIHVSRYGWRTSEPAESHPETPGLCAGFLEALTHRGQAGALCDVADLSPELVAEVAGLTHWGPEETSKVIQMRPRVPVKP